ncbi:MAG TPA: CBS domain-containing protein [Gaiellaceae bacterium]|nr:CBS domain-containing protein [Gaiellaceae bacterium]
MTAATPITSRALGSATVAEAMTSGVIRCAPETPLRAVARLMAEHRVHAIYVFDYGAEDDETVALWGLVCDLDVVAAADGDLDTMTAHGSAVTPLVTISSSDLLADAARRMTETGVSHLAVLDPLSGRPAGVLSTLDVVRFVAGDAPDEGR